MKTTGIRRNQETEMEGTLKLREEKGEREPQES